MSSTRFDNAESQGLTKDEVAETIALAFLHGLSGDGFFSIRKAVSKRLQIYQDRQEPMQYPAGWTREPERLRTGLD